MGGDYTKFTFKPQKDYAGVFKQQGRVDLDADWNELVQIFDRRWRAETIDILGRAVVPNSTPDAFKITPTGPGTFTIGLGRMYVDGLVAENHGVDPEDRFDPVLGETFSQTEVPYSDQPYLPAPLPPPLAGVNGTTDLIYLDVWQREITYIEDPDIKEIALEGPDTATRMQTAWQVRALQNVGGHQCGDDITAWDNLVAPSAGQLTTSVLAPPPSSDPCIISASGGYRGLENRLYRVEIHTAGGLGTAKFKWSRDDASITSAVTAISGAGPYKVTVKRIGRDQVLRFQIGDWVEVLDDYTEFQGQAGQMGSVTNIDEANQILTVTFANAGALSGFDPTNPKRHTRLRRWDEKNGVDTNGLLTVAAGPLPVEDGIQVAFSLDPNITSNTFKVGDYWVFAARTTDGSIEILNQAPPRGILHHYCRLGFLTWPGTFSDCRQHWPPAECDCCTVTVGDGVDSHGQFTDIQQAIDALGASGGLVCIGRGVYVVTDTIRLSTVKSRVIIRGMGPATRIIFAPASANARNFMEIDRAEYVRIEDLYVIGATPGTLLAFLNTSSCVVDKCQLVNVGGQEQTSPGNAPSAIHSSDGCRRLTVRDSLLVAPAGMSLVTVSDLNFRDNTVLAPQSALLFRDAENLEIIHNRLRGVLPEAWTQLLEEGILLANSSAGAARNGVTTFQKHVSDLLNQGGADQLGMMGVFIESGRNLKIERNMIGARIGIVSFLLLAADLAENEILSYFGVLLFAGLLVRLRANLIGGLIFGLLQMGISFGLQCDGNAWLGFYGVAFAGVTDLAGTLLKVLDKLFPGFSNLLKNAGEFTTIPAALSFSITAKFSENIFAGFWFGIFKSATTISSDWNILHNTFLFGRFAGVFLGEGASFQTVTGSGASTGAAAAPRLGPPHHLIEGNAFLVEGKGIVTAVEGTNVRSNTIECGATAIQVQAARCRIEDNYMTAAVREVNVLTGLVSVEEGANLLEIVGNELGPGPGHGILIARDVFLLTIDNNILSTLRSNGISTASNTTRLQGLQLTRNFINNCRGDKSDPAARPPGAVVLGLTNVASITGNTIDANLPGSAGAGVFCSTLSNSEILNNTIIGNGDIKASAQFQAGIWLNVVSNDIKIQGNTVRGSGGPVLVAFGTTNDKLPASLMVQNNSFSSSDANPPTQFLEIRNSGSIQFQGNQCTDPNAAIEVPPASGANAALPPTRLQASNTIMVNANEMRTGPVTVDASRLSGQAMINGNVFFARVIYTSRRGIVTSNLGVTTFPPRPGFIVTSNLP